MIFKLKISLCFKGFSDQVITSLYLLNLYLLNFFYLFI